MRLVVRIIGRMEIAHRHACACAGRQDSPCSGPMLEAGDKAHKCGREQLVDAFDDAQAVHGQVGACPAMARISAWLTRAHRGDYTSNDVLEVLCVRPPLLAMGRRAPWETNKRITLCL